VVRSERLIKLRDSWFSAKSILVERLNIKIEVELLISNGNESFTEFIKTSNTIIKNLGRQTVSAKIHSQKGNSPD
jgi:hypothetical protein